MGYAVKVVKGQKISCGENTSNASVVLNWSDFGYKGSYDIEIDVSAFILYADGKVKSDDDFIYYNNPFSRDGSIKMIESEKGKSELQIDFTNLSQDISKIAITLTIYDAEKRKLNFGQISSLTATLLSSGTKLASYTVGKDDFNIETAIVICEIYRYKNVWKFDPVGEGYKNGLEALCSAFGVKVEEDNFQMQSNPKKQSNPSINKPKAKSKAKPPEVSKKELYGYADSIIVAWKAVDLILRQNNTLAYDILDGDPEIFDNIVFSSIAYMRESFKLERNLKKDIIKKLYSKSSNFTGFETIDKNALQEIIDYIFDKLSFLEVKIGSKSTDASCLYSAIIRAIGQLMLMSTENLCEEDVLVYEGIMDILGDSNMKNAIDILSIRCDANPIMKLNDWYEKFVLTGILLGDEGESLEDLLNELDSYTGLNEVKSDVNSLINMVRIQQVRKERNLPVTPLSLHLVFSGNPGTGKTTVARLIAKIYKAMGLLKKGHLIEVDRSTLVAGYVGQTAIKVSEAVESAIGGVLFIDEAYSLTMDKSGQDFGHEAVDTLLKAMEDRRGEFIVIVAGYNLEMQEFVLSNPGLQSRFNKYIYFEDYQPRELLSIFKGMCLKSDMVLARDAEKYLASFFTQRYNNRSKNYANAREVRNFYEKMLVLQANRLSEKANLTNEDLSYIKYDDVITVNL